jgi:glycosyltransferase involved in cell wall biosynthesis
MRVAKSRYGAITVCDRPSTHICHQDRVMAEEFERQGVAYPPIDPRIIERQLAEYEGCDVIVVPSELNRRTFIEHGVAPSKVRKLPYGVDLRIFKPQPKPDDVFRVLSIGHLSLRKGIPYLLEALAPLKLPEFELCLGGAAPPETRSILARYEGRFRYLGVIPRPRLAEIYNQASVFVLASIEEGLALVQAEAMACGLPVIGTTNTGAEDLFTDGVEGFIAPIRDPEALREKVLLLYHDRELRDQMAAAALRGVQAIGGWDNYGERAARIYAETIAAVADAAYSPTPAPALT